jgi:hypothetical protein
MVRSGLRDHQPDGHAGHEQRGLADTSSLIERKVLLVVAVATVWLVLRWGKWQAWLVAAPIFFFAGVMASMSAIRLLPNLL